MTMTMNANEIETTAPTKSGLSRRLWFWGILLAVLGLPPLLFFAASTLANHTGIPAELEQLPPELTATPEPVLSPESGRPTQDGTVESPGPVENSADPLVAKLSEPYEQEGLRLYMDLLRRFTSKEGGGSIAEFAALLSPAVRTAAWSPGQSLPSGAAEWLTSHAGIVEDLLHLGENPALPLRAREAVERYPKSTAFAHDRVAARVLGNDVFLSSAERILVAEGQRRLEAGDARGAARLWQASVRISLNESGKPPYMSSHSWTATVGHTLDDAVRCLTLWLGEHRDLAEAPSDLPQTLSLAHRCIFPRDWIVRERQQVYPFWREQLVTRANTSPWNTTAFGWDAGPYPWMAHPDRYTFKVLGTELPRLDRLGGLAILAMRNKREAPKVLRWFDQEEVEIVRRGRMTWPELREAGPYAYPLNPFDRRSPLFGNVGMQGSVWSYDDVHAYVLAVEARLNLLRAVIEWRLAPPDAKPDPAAMKIEDRESPWRDPFAEAPFHMTALPDGGGVLIHTLGPDLKDQQGQVEYDPTNGTVSAGDLMLEVKR